MGIKVEAGSPKQNKERFIFYLPDEIALAIIFQSLQNKQNSGVPIAVDYAHYLDPENIDYIESKLTTLGINPASHFQRKKELIQYRKKIDQENISYITVFRDPIAMGLSTIFQNLAFFNIEGKLINKDGKIQVGELRKVFYEQLIEKKSWLNLWFDYDFKSITGLNFSQLEFDQNKGFGITQTPAGNILLLKFEAPNDNISEAIRKFTKIDSFKLVKTILSKDNSTDRLLNQATKQFKLSESLLNSIYSDSNVHLLYSQDEINKFKVRWKANSPQQEYQEYWRVGLAKKRFSEPPEDNSNSTLVIAAGLPRSGSTLLYNVTLQIFEKKSNGICLGYIDPAEIANFLRLYEERPVYCLIKVHESSPLLQKYINADARVLYSYRDVRDIIVSAIHKQFIQSNDRDILNFVQYCMRMSQCWEHANNLLEVKYEEMAFNVHELVQIVMDFLKINLSSQEVVAVTSAVNYEAALKSSENMERIVSLNNGATVFDAKTQLHRNHLAGGAIGKHSTELPKEQIESIEKISYHWLLSHGYEISFYRPEPVKRYFSEHGEDFVLWKFFDFKDEGFFVDVGAFDGVYLSKTYSFELGGWQGICVEADPDYAQLLDKNRPVSINISSVVVEKKKPEKVSFYCDSSGLFSSLSSKSRPVPFDSVDYFPIHKKIKKKLATDTLTSILTKHVPREKILDFITINVAGTEAQVLQGLDFDIYCPRLIIISASEANSIELKAHMASQKYTHAITLGNSLFFVRTSEDIERLRGIEINCLIEKQVHPKGMEFSIKDYLYGTQLIKGKKANDSIQKLKSERNLLSTISEKNKQKANLKIQELENDKKHLTKIVEQNEQKANLKIQELENDKKNLSEIIDRTRQDLESLEKTLGDNETRVSVCLESVQENIGLNADDLRFFNDVHFNNNTTPAEKLDQFCNKLNKSAETPLINDFKTSFSKRLKKSDHYRSTFVSNAKVDCPNIAPPCNIDLKNLPQVSQQPGRIVLSELLPFLRPIDNKYLRIIRSIQRSGLFHYFHYTYNYPEVLEKDFEPLAHYVLHGANEGKTPNLLFESQWYLNHYPEVCKTGVNPLFHYIERGAKKGYDPGPSFSTTAYLQANPDVASSGINPLYHYLQFGAAEGRNLR